MGEHEQTGHRRLLLGRRVRARRHQEARAHAARQGRRSHAAHGRAARADRLVFLTYRAAPDVDAIARRVDRDGAALRLHRGRRRAAHGLARRRTRTRPRSSRRSRRCRRCTSPTAIIARRAPRGRAPSCRAPAAATRRCRRPSSRSRFPTTRCRSCRTTATVKDLAGPIAGDVPRRAARERVDVADGPATPRAQGRSVDVPRRRVARARSRGVRAAGRFARERARRRAAAAARARAAARIGDIRPTSASTSSAARAARRRSRKRVDVGQGGGRVLDVPGDASTT